MKLFLNGMRFAEKDKPAYRFRHIENLMRKFSYCFFVSDGSAAHFWAFFHNMGGLDSGGHNISLKMVEEMIATNLSTHLKCVDIEYAKLCKFLSEHVTAFNRVKRNTISFDLDQDLGNFGVEFSKTYSKFLENCDNGEYSQALRDLRALLQTAMEKVCEEKGAPLPDKPGIANLCGSLVEHGVLNGREKPRYDAFSSVANSPAHRVSPAYGDLLDQNTKNRAKMTIALGTQIIDELGGMMSYADDFDEDYSDVPEV